ncbi:MAG TPA: UDP-N-acetylmuramoyl-L-alanyl-D-glutamate--2,6-diaminopimelate ligase [Blastocatellia bacterium]|nr:UDP-N-acetylmuramoyl-L-alanyl-D-glutamate--2,6-diaminopimelate ligase [Blastocatellia bacterium]HMX25841.1 UDP-N-acetylmuramoyl-L-alanyl-D-glutamate--2,6-diaminopimelate ligase [Blastocatellia bacterium]HMY74278.1 UDP-N-acetylmuramoyl-L-alanyl-D-glutamate--2,6-diaminopimelate ligase [Blastocatellia bacterium]HMZ20502.1 UDP-N-acetylmuramoyl-L-alanyl-D-glutamate--2,6-diaminopimelate ligase [Blastocatellia bacterium]HNG31405.1 UDP-N-acetylmuramoyl-L-alanyl-D-glutamate--2,6-diaminopimelate ligas
MVTLSEIANYLNARAGGGQTGKLATAVGAFNASVTHDSRRVRPGGIFVAITGAQVDGNQFVAEAVKRGAIAVISEKPRPDGFNAVWMQVANAREALAKAAAVVQGFPSRKLALVGLTGTNGKTTTTYLVNSIFAAAGKKTAVMGTIGYRIGDEKVDAEFTTPEASEIQDFLRRAVDSGVTHAAMEVSSIALEMHRADELEFAAAAFTNLTQDHLDFHGTMENYFTSKKKLFDGSIGQRPARSVLNLDDPRGVELKDVCGATALTYALDADADVTTTERQFGLDGLHFIADTPAGEIEIASPLVGRPHAYNTLCAVGIGLVLGFDCDVIARGINQCTGVAGRFERVSSSEDDITVVVDYAHTPDALVNVLNSIRDAQLPAGSKQTVGRVITVMGCGGDRDRTKRPLMGEAAAKLSDWVIATSDNPRSENPVMILNDIRIGLDRVIQNYELIVDRREAIFRAVTLAKPNDVVLIAGKGHETYQILPTGKIHFDDREVGREALAERRAKLG